MKKFFSILAAVLFAGSMMAAEAVLQYTGSVTANMVGDGANNAATLGLDADLFTVLADKGSSQTLPGLNKAGDIRLYADKNAGNGNIITVSIASGTITSIVLDIKQTATFVVKAGETVVTEANGAYAINAASFSIQNTTTGATTQLQLNKITITYEAGAAPAVSTPVITGDASFYETAEISIACSTEGANVYYTLDGAEPTAESALYAAPFEINATTTVKAIAIKGEDKSAVAEKTFTKATVLTVAQALALDLSTPVANQYVEGIVSKVESFNSTYGSITYWISDNGEQANELEVYGGLAMNGDKFEAQDDLAVGDKVVVFGTLKKYNDTKEFDKNNYLVAFEPAGTVVSTCDWDNIEWLGDGSPELTFGNQFKVCKDGAQPGVVNIQKPGWAAETGIYLTFPSAAFGEISLPENKYVKEGAGIVFYLSAFTAKETEVSVMCEGNEIIFTVYNDKGTDEATSLINTKPEVKAVKTVINGQVVIIRDGKMINVLGVQL